MFPVEHTRVKRRHRCQFTVGRLSSLLTDQISLKLRPLQTNIMKSSSSSSPSSTSVTATEAQLASSSSSPRPPPSLQSPELQDEFLRACRIKFRSRSDITESCDSSPLSPSSPVSSPCTPTLTSSPQSSSSSPGFSSRQARLSLSSPELLSELKDSKTRPLKHVPAHHGLTTVFSGQGRGRGRGRGRASPD
ncbi:uncharacterized serine-rich protein C215.13-like isoform X2 [Acanthopagrus latus]|uniref:uncharacterized serine-rich protein C215.13-like isoform X2 n=1 Tax=Acanthopagrus latus TaxID=8177 RepID=UPI00187C4552|nr:uncharacterized serine-rich protein C215.13-like isoform X2 [Acanthopagrus latus]